MNLSTKQQILRAIQKSGQDGIENHRLVDITLRYGARITDLRNDGYDIQVKRVWRNGKASGTYVYYIQQDKLADNAVVTSGQGITPTPKEPAKQQDLIPRERRLF